jgi:hypothetical protein
MSSDSSLELVGASKMQDGSYAYINLFPVQLPVSQEDPVWRVVDFSSIMSVGPPPKLVPILRKAKHLEMTEEARLLFKRKLAAFFGR